MVLAGQFQNGVLARYPEAVAEIATFAIASGTFGMFHACINFVSQMSNVYGRSTEGRRRCLRFVVAASVVITLPLLVIAFAPIGARLLSTVYGVGPDVAQHVTTYLKLLAPLTIIDAFRQYCVGLIVQARLTGWVTVLNLIHLTTFIGALLLGFSEGFAPVYVLTGAQALGAVVHLGLLIWVVRARYRPPTRQEHANVSRRELIEFFMPVATTGVMFAISRPVLYALVARTPDAIVSIAALRVGFDVATLFQVTANQFRHFFVTFGDDALAEKRRFMVLIGLGITACMLLIAATPVSRLLLADLIGIEGEVLRQGREVLLLMCLLPGLILWRNYYHGLLMVARATAGMAWGGMTRVAGIYVMAQACFVLGLLNHFTSTVVLLLGFALEAAIVTVIWRRRRQR
tara:strand:+ start:772 stop:1977 length:1206 start_codon:yes stop_codon:yes gene_type:complete